MIAQAVEDDDDDDDLRSETWNHRVFKTQASGDDVVYQIREAYYGKDDKKLPKYWTTDAVKIGGESVEDIVKVLGWISLCLDAPVHEEYEHDGITLVREVE